MFLNSGLTDVLEFPFNPLVLLKDARDRSVEINLLLFMLLPPLTYIAVLSHVFHPILDRNIEL